MIYSNLPLVLLFIVFHSQYRNEFISSSKNPSSNYANPGSQMDSSNMPLKIQIHTTKQSFSENSNNLSVNIDVVNQTQKVLLISDPKYSVSTRLLLKKNGVVVPSIKIKPVLSKIDEFITIKPGGTFSTIFTYTVDKYFSHLSTGKYEIQANYSGKIFANAILQPADTVISNNLYFSI